MVATDRETLRSETEAYEYAERRIKLWAFERNRQDEQERAARELYLSIRAARMSDTASTAVFHGKKQETTKQRIKREHQERQERDRERAEREQARKAELAARCGSGPVRRCTLCRTIYRGDAETCGCKLCPHCGQRFRGKSFKCDPCKHDPELVTARGSETQSFVPRREAQPTIMSLSRESKRIEALLEELPIWMMVAIHERYRLKRTDEEAAEALRVSVSWHAGRVRAAVARMAQLLANDEHAPV